MRYIKKANLLDEAMKTNSEEFIDGLSKDAIEAVVGNTTTLIRKALRNRARRFARRHHRENVLDLLESRMVVRFPNLFVEGSPAVMKVNVDLFKITIYPGGPTNG